MGSAGVHLPDVPRDRALDDPAVEAHRPGLGVVSRIGEPRLLEQLRELGRGGIDGLRLRRADAEANPGHDGQ